MAYLIGTDEAGYGPNLGPLVVAASLWEIPDSLPVETDLFELLHTSVRVEPVELNDTEHLAIADSKRLYSPGNGLAQLERGVLPALLTTHQLDDVPCDWKEVYAALSPDCPSQLDELPWYRPFVQSAPVDVASEVVIQLTRRWTRILAEADARLMRLQSYVCLPRPFNEAVEREGSKGTVLSQITLRLVADLVSGLEEGPILVQCDKHGGRNRYNHLLQEVFPDHLIEVYRESRSVSIYRWGPDGRRIEARFVAKGERFLPTALASMAAKYQRELAMKAFNHFWLKYVPDIKPTAGYPTDARRFKVQIETAQKALGIQDIELWRQR